MFRIPKQTGSVDLYESLFSEHAKCRGVLYTGAQDLGRLIANPLHGPSFCSAGWFLGSATWFAGASSAW